jgi:hypothetical protein
MAPEEVKVPLRLRIPAWAEGAEIKGLNLDYTVTDAAMLRMDSAVVAAKGRAEYFGITAKLQGTRTISLRLPMPVRLYHGFNDAVAIERGPLVYALKIGAEWKKVKDNAQFADWEVYSTTPWNYALELDRAHPARSVSFEERPVGSCPFSVEGAPMAARVKGRRLPGWTIEKGAAAPPPRSPVKSVAGVEELTLIPYGCTDLRITEFPTLASR